jgi:hypothetical protein
MTNSGAKYFQRDQCDSQKLPRANVMVRRFFCFARKGLLMIHKLARHRVLTAAILTFAVSTSIWPGTATAQENDGWKFRISPYL